MSRTYRIDIDLTIDKPCDDCTSDDFDYVKYNLLPYLFDPYISPQDTDTEAARHDIASEYDLFDCDVSYADRDKGFNRTFIQCSRVTQFSGGHSVKDYEYGVGKQIDWLKDNLPYAFSVEVRATCLDIDPEVFIYYSSLIEEK